MGFFIFFYLMSKMLGPAAFQFSGICFLVKKRISKARFSFYRYI